MMTEDTDIARAQFEMGAACLVQFQRIADTFERVLPLLERLTNPTSGDPMERAVALLMKKPDATQDEFSEAVGLSRGAIFPGAKREAEQELRVAAGSNPPVAQQLRDFYRRAFAHVPQGRRGHNDGNGNVDGEVW